MADPTAPTQGPDPRVLQELYQTYLQQSVNLAEANAKLQVRVAELEAQMKDSSAPAE